MTAPVPWLGGRRALVAGAGAAVDRIAEALRAAGATLVASTVTAGGEDGIADEMATLFDAGGIDILIHGGVVAPGRDALTMGLNAWRAEVSADIDLRFLHSAEFVRRCLAAGQAGAILFLMPPVRPRAGHVVATSVSGALDNLVKSLAIEWARDGIRVNGIATRLYEDGTDDDPSAAESLGHLAAYLVSDYGAYISGMVMGIDEA